MIRNGTAGHSTHRNSLGHWKLSVISLKFSTLNERPLVSALPFHFYFSFQLLWLWGMMEFYLPHIITQFQNNTFQNLFEGPRAGPKEDKSESRFFSKTNSARCLPDLGTEDRLPAHGSLKIRKAKSEKCPQNLLEIPPNSYWPQRACPRGTAETERSRSGRRPPAQGRKAECPSSWTATESKTKTAVQKAARAEGSLYNAPFQHPAHFQKQVEVKNKKTDLC